MNQQKICIIGDGLASLTTAAILSNENINIDIYTGIKKINKIIDSRTTAISESNYKYIKDNLHLTKDSFFWSCKEINLFFEHEKKIINFLNFDEKKKIICIFFKTNI